MSSPSEPSTTYAVPPPPPPGPVGGDSRGQFRPLVVDELDDPAGRPRSPAFDPTHIRGSDRIKPRGSTRSGSIKNIGPLEQHAAAGSNVHACPCCRRYVPGTSPSSVTQTPPENHLQSQRGVVEKSASDDQEEAGLIGSIRATGSTDSADNKTGFEIHEIVARGWVHKKGTGKDWLGSRSWKPRWAVLALAFVPGYDVDVPLLLVYWYSSSDKPSNVIVLDGTVVMAVDRYKTEKKVVEWNTYTFEVVHTSNKGDSAGNDKEDQENQVTRTFSVPEKERNEWVFNINKALLDYEKRLTKHRNDRAAKEALQQRRSPLTVNNQTDHPYDECDAGPVSPVSPGRSVRRAASPTSPPTSPRGRSPATLKPALSPRGPAGGLGALKPPLSPRASPKGSMASMKSVKPLSPVGRRAASITAEAAAAAAAVGKSGSSLSYSASMALDESTLAGLNISLPED